MSYARLARAGNIYTQLETRDPGAGSKAIPPFERATTEVRSQWRQREMTRELMRLAGWGQNYALDSMENLLFSIARFKEYVPSELLYVLPSLTALHLQVYGPLSNPKYDHLGAEDVE